MEKCEQSISNILSVDVKERWTVAGGKIETIPEAKTAQLGDKQRRKWFKRSLDKSFCVFFLGCSGTGGVLFEMVWKFFVSFFVGLVCFEKGDFLGAKWVW